MYKRIGVHHFHGAGKGSASFGSPRTLAEFLTKGGTNSFSASEQRISHGVDKYGIMLMFRQIFSSAASVLPHKIQVFPFVPLFYFLPAKLGNPELCRFKLLFAKFGKGLAFFKKAPWIFPRSAFRPRAFPQSVQAFNGAVKGHFLFFSAIFIFLSGFPPYTLPLRRKDEGKASVRFQAVLSILPLSAAQRYRISAGQHRKRRKSKQLFLQNVIFARFLRKLKFLRRRHAVAQSVEIHFSFRKFCRDNAKGEFFSLSRFFFHGVYRTCQTVLKPQAVSSDKPLGHDGVGAASSAAAEGVGAQIRHKIANREIRFVTHSRNNGVLHSKIARASSSPLKAQRSSTEPPPRPIITVSAQRESAFFTARTSSP